MTTSLSGWVNSSSCVYIIWDNRFVLDWTSEILACATSHGRRFHMLKGELLRRGCTRSFFRSLLALSEIIFYSLMHCENIAPNSLLFSAARWWTFELCKGAASPWPVGDALWQIYFAPMPEISDDFYHLLLMLRPAYSIGILVNSSVSMCWWTVSVHEEARHLPPAPQLCGCILMSTWHFQLVSVASLPWR